MGYLHHQWPDGADTLQFDSTDEYFETVEDEPHRLLELRDRFRKHPDFQSISLIFTLSQRLEPLLIPIGIKGNSPPRLQIDPAPPSRGVRRCSWALGVVFRTR